MYAMYHQQNDMNKETIVSFFSYLSRRLYPLSDHWNFLNQKPQYVLGKKRYTNQKLSWEERMWKRMDIYIKPMEKTQIIKRREIFLRDVAEVFIGGQTAGEAEKLVVFQVPEERKKTYLLSVMDVIRTLNQKYPDATVSNVGEMDILIEYLPKPERKTRLWTGMKVAFVSLILFIGAATTIMCFHSDTQLPLIFQNVYYIFYGENKELPSLLSVPYSIGLGLGIIIFFNHFARFFLTQDPTPIEIEMTTYEKEANANMIDTLEKRKAGNQAK